MLQLLLSLFLVVSFELCHVNSVVPISSYTQSYSVNGKLSTKNTLLVTCTESDPFGSFIAGNYKQNVTCVPPVFTYKVKEVARVPQNTVLLTNKNCLVTDSASYIQGQKDALATLYANNTNLAGFSGNAQDGRSLQFGFVDFLGILIPGLGVGLLQKQVDSLTSEVGKGFDNILNNKFPDVYSQLKNLTARGDFQQGQLNATNIQIQALTAGQQAILNNIKNNSQAFQDFKTASDQFAKDVAKKFDTINNNTQLLKNDYDQKFTSTQQQFKDAFLSITNLVGNSTNNLQQEIDTLTRTNVKTSDNLNSIIKIITKQIRQTTAKRQATVSFFRSLANLPSNIVPFTLGQGFKPYGNLIGADNRVLIELINLNWVSAVTNPGTSSASYQIVNSQVNFYVDSYWAVDNIQFVNGLEDWITLFRNPGNCSRSFTDVDDVSRDLTNRANPCEIWVEIRTYSCTSQRFPQFSWDASASRSIDPSLCLASPTLDSRFSGPRVVKTFDDLVGVFQTDYCQSLTFSITSTRTNLKLLMPQNLGNCKKSYKDQSYDVESNGLPSVLYQVIGLFALGSTYAYSDTYNRELKLYGRNPGGMKYEKVPDDYTPSKYNGTVPIYDPLSTPLDCTHSSWLGVDINTVPMVSIQPSAALPVKKSILVSVTGQPCSDPTQCYTVGDKDVTQNIDLDVSAVASLPGSFLALGFMNDFSQGIWDVPARSISASYVAGERGNTVGYIAMDPGTTTTFTLPDWQGKNFADYDPTLGSVSPGYYKFKALADASGSPYCALADTAPVNSYQTTTYGCVAPFFGSQALNTYLNSVMPAQCPQKKTAQILLQDYQTQVNNNVFTLYSSSGGTTQIPSIIAGSQDYTVSYQYSHDQVLGNFQPVSIYKVQSAAANNYIQFYVNANGQPAVKMNNFDTSSYINSNVNIKDGFWHQVVVTVQTSVSNQYAFGIFVDGVQILSIINNVASFGSRTDLLVSQPYQQTPISYDAQVRYFSINTGNRIMTANEIYYYWQCSQYDSSSLQCASNVYSTSLSFQNVTQTGSAQCAAFQYLQRTYNFDRVYPLSVDFSQSLATVQTISFWIRGGNTNLATNTILMQLQIGPMFVVVTYSGSTTINIKLGASGSLNFNVWDTLSHRFNIEFFSNNNNFIVTLDQASSQTVVSSPPSTFANTFSAQNNNIFMVKWYAGVDMPFSTIANEIACLMDSSVLSKQYLPPVGICKQASSTSLYGYCRQPYSCIGHCENYAVVDQTTGTYSVLANQCDPSYAVPDCKLRCSRIDSQTGSCVDVVVRQASGLTPDSIMCQVMANYKVSYNPSQQTLQLVPRVWQYTASITVPSGVITQVINTGGCPQSSISGNIDGTFTVNLANSDTNPTYVQITYAPDGVFNGTAPCIAGCCVLSTDKIIQVPGSSTASSTLPGDTCGALTVIVSLISNSIDPYSNSTSTQLSTCTTFTSQQVISQISSSANAPVSFSVQNALAVSYDTSTNDLKNVVQAVLANTIQLFGLASQIGINNQTFLTALGAASTNINNLKYTPSNISLDTSPFDISKYLNATDKAAKLVSDSVAETIKSISDQTKILNDAQTVFNDQLDRAQQARAIIILRQQKMDDELHDFVFNPTSRGGAFSDFLEDVVKLPVEGVLAAAHLGESIIDKGLNLLSLPLNAAGNFFSNLIKTAINVAIIAAVVYLGIKILPGLLNRSKSAMPSYDNRRRYEEEPEYTQLKSIKTSKKTDEPPVSGLFKMSNTASYSKAAQRNTKNKYYQPSRMHDED